MAPNRLWGVNYMGSYLKTTEILRESHIKLLLAKHLPLSKLLYVHVQISRDGVGGCRVQGVAPVGVVIAQE